MKLSLFVFLVLFGLNGFAYSAASHGHNHQHEEHQHDHHGAHEEGHHAEHHEDHHDEHEHHGEGYHHAHEAPHGGTLVVFGNEFAHLEFVLDQASGKLTAYALDGEARNAIRLTQPAIEMTVSTHEAEETILLKAAGSLLTGESVGNTSQFMGVGTALIGADHFDAVITQIDIKGQVFTNVSFPFPEGNE